MEISYFKKITQTSGGEKLSIDGFLQSVKLGTWEKEVMAIRQGDPDKVRELKKNLPYVTPSGTFSERKNDGLIQHSGFICIDMDKIGDVDETFTRLQSDPYIYGLFRSASGAGIAAFIKIDGKRHLDAFLALEKYFTDKYEVIIDKSCKDIARPRFVSYDPQTYINQQAEVFKNYLLKKDKPKQLPKVITGKNDMDHIIEQIHRRGIDITHDSYQRFLEIGFALSNEYGEDGRVIFHQVVSNASKYKPDVADRQFNHCLKATGHGITISTFYYYCKEEGISLITEETRRMITVATIAKKSGRGAYDAVRLLTEVEGFGQDLSKEITEKVYASEDLSKENALGKLDLIEQFLNQNYNLKRNEITRFVENNGKEIDSTFSNSVYIRLRKQVDDSIKFEEVDKLIHSEFTPDYNPLKEFFEKRELKDVSGTIDNFIECLDSSTGESLAKQYKHTFFKKWLVGIVASIYEKHSPLCLVLTGGQNTGKTEFFRRLLPSELFPYYAESKLDAGKDDEILMTQKILILDDEFGGKSKLESKRFKELTSKQYFTLREPYGRKNVRLRRMSVLAGTSNETEIINDPTGNRRVIPLEVNRIDFNLYNSINKTDLFIEAFQLFQSGFNYELNKQEIELLNKNTLSFEQVRQEKELITMFVKRPSYAQGFEVATYLQTTEIKAIIEKNTMQRINIYKLSQELKALGFEQFRKKINGISCRVWLCVPVDAAKVDSEDSSAIQFGDNNGYSLPF